MRTVLVLAACAAVLNAAVFRMETKNSGSLRRRLILAGTYTQFLQQQLAARASSGSQPLIDFYDDFYLSNITLGTPPQQFTIVPDTGSSNLWVIDAACTDQACQGYPDSGYTKHRFDTTKSSTFKKDGQFFSIQYGSGSCNGYLGVDKVSFAGLSYATQKFGVATSIADVFGYQPVDGIMGLGWPALSVDNVVPPMQNLLSSLDKPLFTFWMDRKTQLSSGGSGGLITYGAVDTTNCAAQVDYVSLSAETYWQFPMNGFSMGSYKENRRQQVISDTGTSWIGAPNSYADKMAKQAGGSYDYDQQLYTVPCSAQKTAPSVVLNIGGKQYSVPAVEYILDLGLGGGTCALTFFGMDGGGFGPAWILGDTFIRSYCNVYDIGQKRIGFALAKHSKL